VLYWFENLTNRPTEKTGLTEKFYACKVDHLFLFLKQIADSAYTVKSDLPALWLGGQIFSRGGQAPLAPPLAPALLWAFATGLSGFAICTCCMQSFPSVPQSLHPSVLPVSMSGRYVTTCVSPEAMQQQYAL